MAAVRKARARVRCAAASKALRGRCLESLMRACVLLDEGLHRGDGGEALLREGGRLSASVSWALRDRLRTLRPKRMSGSTMSGMASRTRPESFGLVTTIMTTAPISMTQIAQRDRGRGRESGFDLGRVGGEPRDDLAGAVRARRRRGSGRGDARTRRSRISATMRSPSQVTR